MRIERALQSDVSAEQLAAEIRLALTELADARQRACRVIAEARELWEGRGDKVSAILLEALEALAGTTRELPRADTARIPRWDPKARILTLGSNVVKQYRVPSRNQEAVLAAFQEEGWPHRIDDPLPPRKDLHPKYRLHFTIQSLNQSQRERLIRFFGDGTGEGICWEASEVVALPFSSAASAAQVSVERRAA
jgi:hypothetical protein